MTTTQRQIVEVTVAKVDEPGRKYRAGVYSRATPSMGTTAYGSTKAIATQRAMRQFTERYL